MTDITGLRTQAIGHTDKWTNKHTNKLSMKYIAGLKTLTDCWTHRQMDKQTDRQAIHDRRNWP